MNDEKWQDIVNMIQNKFEVLDKTREEIPIGDDLDEGKNKETIEAVVFTGPLGKMKIERSIKPRVLDKKVHYTKREGSAAKVEYEYSDTETTQKMKIYKWSDEDNNWTEIEANKLGI